MKLPHNKNIFIPRKKLTEYLLSEIHPIGSSKAKFFRKLGFNETNIDELVKSLSKIAQSGDVKEVRKLIYGVNYSFDGKMKTPTGKTTVVRTVWFIKAEGNKPSFVTAYPV